MYVSGINSGVEAPLVDYEVYYVMESLLNAKTEQYKDTEHEINLLSRCGLEHMIDIVQPDINIDINTNDYGMVYVENHDANPTGYDFTDISPGEKFVFFVVPKCDWQCMEQISETHPSSNVQCTYSNPCKTIYGLLSPGEGTRTGGGIFGGGDFSWGLVIAAVAAVIAVALGGLGLRMCLKRGGGVGRLRLSSGFNWRGRGSSRQARQPDLSDLSVEPTFSPFRVDGVSDYTGEKSIELGEMNRLPSHVIDDEDDGGLGGFGGDGGEGRSFVDPAGDVRDEGYKPPVNPISDAVVEREDDNQQEFHI